MTILAVNAPNNTVLLDVIYIYIYISTRPFIFNHGLPRNPKASDRDEPIYTGVPIPIPIPIPIPVAVCNGAESYSAAGFGTIEA